LNFFSLFIDEAPRVVPTLVTLNIDERRNCRYSALFNQNQDTLGSITSQRLT